VGVTADIPRNGELRIPRRHRKHRRISKPLKLTPPLGQEGYVFPVVGDAGFIDTYGDFRSDVHGKWHHGDDIFASLGTPVVAVADGTINRVGWRKAGGWRLWVRDSLANEFYYAHLSGYARTVFHSRYVKAGQVIGFIGNTGDAFPRASHLHFEIHPHQLLRLNYDGAVDPTSYLESWRHLQSVPTAEPKLPRLPRQALVRDEARLVFRQLLATRQPPENARAATSVAADAGDRPLALPRPAPVMAAAAAPTPHDGVWQLVAAVLLGTVSLLLVGTAAFRSVWTRGERHPERPET
jgi:hypothetical protein